MAIKTHNVPMTETEMEALFSMLDRINTQANADKYGNWSQIFMSYFGLAEVRALRDRIQTKLNQIKEKQ